MVETFQLFGPQESKHLLFPQEEQSARESVLELRKQADAREGFDVELHRWAERESKGSTQSFVLTYICIYIYIFIISICISVCFGFVF